MTANRRTEKAETENIVHSNKPKRGKLPTNQESTQSTESAASEETPVSQRRIVRKKEGAFLLSYLETP